MLEPAQVGHLLFRNTVSEALDALVGGQSNFAVVPFYNSITQWEGATVKALATGQYEVFAQTCMPTSYVLAAHREHINIALSLYANERGIQQDSLPDFTEPFHGLPCIHPVTGDVIPHRIALLVVFCPRIVPKLVKLGGRASLAARNLADFVETYVGAL